MKNINKIDKSVYKVIRGKDDVEEEVFYWLDKSVQERIEAVEFLRTQYIQIHGLSEKMDKSAYEIHYGRPL